MYYYIGDIQVSEARFVSIYSKLSLSNLDWEIDVSDTRTTIYILG